MTKRLISTIITLVMILSLIPAFPVQAATSGIYTYTVASGNVTIVDCDTSASGVITIPSYFGEYPVTSIGYGAFEYCNSLTSITMPNSIINISSNAFHGCSSLTNIIIPNGVTNINYSTFEGCISLVGVTIPSSVTNITDYAFRSCRSLASVMISSNITNIDSGVFYGCSNLMEIIVDDQNLYYYIEIIKTQ